VSTSAPGQFNPQGTHVVSTPVGSAEDNAFTAKQEYGGNFPIAGPFNTQDAANQSVAQEQTTIDIPGIGNPLTGINAVGDFFMRLTQANTWLRIGEVAIGILLLAVGIASMTHAIPTATKIASVIK
jgi:hypothetical protein